MYITQYEQNKDYITVIFPTIFTMCVSVNVSQSLYNNVVTVFTTDAPIHTCTCVASIPFVNSPILSMGGFSSVVNEFLKLLE